METSFQGIYVPPIAGTLRLQNVFTMSPNRCLGCLRSIHLPDHELIKVECLIPDRKAFNWNIQANSRASKVGKVGLPPLIT